MSAVPALAPAAPPLASWLDLLRLARDPLAGFTAAMRTRGDVVAYAFGGTRIAQVTHPDDVATVLGLPVAATRKSRVVRGLRRALGDGMLTSEGETWKRQRRLAAPAFTPARIASYGAAMGDAVRASLPATSGPTDVHAANLQLALEVVVRVLFGADGGVDARVVGGAITEIQDEFWRSTNTWRRLLPDAVPRPGRTREARAIIALNAQIQAVIARRRTLPEGPDLLGRLLAVRDDDGSALSDEALRDELVTLFVAGHETTALAVAYTLWLLAGDADTQARVRAEVDALPGLPTAADIRGMTWTMAALHEAMRLYPPGFAIARELVDDTVLGGFVVPKGTQVLLPVCAIHRDARWWPEPDAFRPRRWIDATPSSAAYLPFGGGGRACIGKYFAELEAAVMIAGWLRAYTLDRPEALRLAPAATLRPADGVHLRLTPRERPV
jgi:cytochrome P450